MIATEAEAHAEWHAVTGLRYGCPQDACWAPEPEPETTTFDALWLVDYRFAQAWNAAFDALYIATCADLGELPF